MHPESHQSTKGSNYHSAGTSQDVLEWFSAYSRSYHVRCIGLTGASNRSQTHYMQRISRIMSTHSNRPSSTLPGLSINNAHRWRRIARASCGAAPAPERLAARASRPRNCAALSETPAASTPAHKATKEAILDVACSLCRLGAAALTPIVLGCCGDRIGDRLGHGASLG